MYRQHANEQACKQAGLCNVQGVSKTFEEYDAAISPALPQLVSHVRSGAQVSSLAALHLRLLPTSHSALSTQHSALQSQ